jgi:hypothetical protein
MEEQWKVIPDIPDYAVSNLGNFKRLTPGKGTQEGKPRRTYINPVTGYRNVTFGNSGVSGTKAKTFSAHRLVAEVWIPNPNNYKCVDHINRDRTDNRVENLRWASYLMNTPSKPIEFVSEAEVLTFPSMVAAGKHFKTSTSTISKYLREGKVYRGYTLKLISDKPQ